MYIAPSFALPSEDTIFALSSAPGRAGVSVVRISGSKACTALSAFGLALEPLPRHAHYARLRSAEGQLIDDVVLVYFPAPHSYTGHPVIELHCHGSRAVLQEVFAVLAALPGFRHAEAGEFTRQAWWNGKLDLTQAEGIADLINAETLEQKRQAQRFTSGEVGKIYDKLREQLIEALAYLEALIDFPDEEIPHDVPDWVMQSVDKVQATLEGYLADGNRGQRIREGISIVIAGPPNVGKSSLINFLARDEVAIVSPVAGTTRDAVSAHLDIGGFAVTITDTAGLRRSEDAIESEGMRRARKKWDDADIRLLMLDNLHWEDAEAVTLVDESDKVIVNKAELLSEKARATIPQDWVVISLETKENSDIVSSEISALLQNRFIGTSPALITHSRHRAAIEKALFHVKQFTEVLALELKAEELRSAAAALHEITGGLHVEDVLDKVFSSFCIGK